MDAEKPSARSRTRSSAAASKAGSEPASKAAPVKRTPAARAPATRAARPAAAMAPLALLERAVRGDFPPTVYLEGSDEAVKAAFLAELRRSWAASVPEAPRAR